jgi:hypothetical protein
MFQTWSSLKFEQKILGDKLGANALSMKRSAAAPLSFALTRPRGLTNTGGV